MLHLSSRFIAANVATIGIQADAAPQGVKAIDEIAPKREVRKSKAPLSKEEALDRLETINESLLRAEALKREARLKSLVKRAKRKADALLESALEGSKNELSSLIKEVVDLLAANIKAESAYSFKEAQKVAMKLQSSLLKEAADSYELMEYILVRRVAWWITSGKCIKKALGRSGKGSIKKVKVSYAGSKIRFSIVGSLDNMAAVNGAIARAELDRKAARLDREICEALYAADFCEAEEVEDMEVATSTFISEAEGKYIKNAIKADLVAEKLLRYFLGEATIKD